MRNNNQSSVLLNNERSGHVEKLVNELSTFKFFKYIYARDMFKIIGLNLLISIFLVPLIILYYNYSLSMMTFNSNLPLEGSLGLGFNFWVGLNQYSTVNQNLFSTKFWVYMIPCLVAIAFGFAGGVCVLRDSFWTGRVSVIKRFFIGIYQCGIVAIVGFAVIGAFLFGIMKLNMVIATLAGVWQVLINILLWVLFVLIAIYVFVLISVSATYKQNILVNMKAAWTLMWKYFVSTLLNFLISLVPLFLLLLLGNGTLGILIICFVAIIGMFYIVLVWQTHMMKIFSIYHPVEKKVVKRKKQAEETVAQSR